MIQPKKFTVYHAIGIFIIANLISFLPAGFNGNEVFYNSFKLPAVAPPSWLFPPAWFFNNVTSLYALYKIANLEASAERRGFLVAEAITWVLFAIFTTVYFGLKSPILGAIDTALALVFTIVSLILAFKLSKAAFWGILPRFLWLALATFVSIYAAIINRDEFFNIGR